MSFSVHRSARWAAAVAAGLALSACDTERVLEVEFPGQIPTEQINDPALAAVLVGSVIGDFECAYSNYMSGSAVHSDEFETANSNVPLANWGERTITADENDYAVGTCEGNFGSNLTLHTARSQAEAVGTKLTNWTDAQISPLATATAAAATRASLRAQAKIYGAYAYLLMGEGFCRVAFDGAADQPPSAALVLAETRFAEGLVLAQAAGNTDMINLARVGTARVKIDLAKWSEAETFAAAVTATYNKDVGRGQESNRRWNKLFRLANQTGAYTVATAYRTTGDPRVLVVDAGRGAFNAAVRLWITTKHPALTSPMRLASAIEANLIRAEAAARQNQVVPAMNFLNTRRAAVGLPALTATTQAEAITHVIDERAKELSFEGGHRLNDLLRNNIAWKVGSNPFSGRVYGTTRCWPHPTRETNGV